MKYLLTIVLCLFAGVSSAADDTLVEQITTQSRYYGVGWQNDGRHWSIEAVIQNGTGAIAYPSLGCSGVWELSKVEKAYVDVFESIKDGRDVCMNEGIVRLRPLNNGRLMYSFYEPGQPPLARAVLLPVSELRENYMSLLMTTLTTIDFRFMLPEFKK